MADHPPYHQRRLSASPVRTAERDGYAAITSAISFFSNAAMSSPRFAFAAATERSFTGP